MRTPAILFVAATLASAALAQNAPAKPLAFDVVSIRPSKPGGNMYFQIQPDGFTAQGILLGTVIYLAFPQEISTTSSIKGLPDWVSKDNYDFIAKVGAENLDAWEKTGHSRYKKPMLEAMLQTALAERCKLAFHFVPAEISARAIVVDKGGARLKPADPAVPPAANGMKLAGGGSAVFTGKDRNHIEWTFHDATMEDLTNFLNNGAVVRDQTNLTGRYDFVLAQEPYDPPDPTPGLPTPPRPPGIWELKPLGLRFDPVKITIQTVVIDHIEKPTAN